jgi:hypothetical protein
MMSEIKEKQYIKNQVKLNILTIEYFQSLDELIISLAGKYFFYRPDWTRISIQEILDHDIQFSTKVLFSKNDLFPFAVNLIFIDGVFINVEE